MQKKSFIIRADLADGTDGIGVNFLNLNEYLEKQFSGYPKNAIILLSPFHNTDNKEYSKVNRMTGLREDLKASIYSPNRFFNIDNSGKINLDFDARLGGSENLLRDICGVAKSHNSVIMYDLILNQIGPGSEQLKELKEKFVAKYPNVILINQENAFGGFNYACKEVRMFIFDELHKPLIDKLIDLGIRGFRIDAVDHIDIEYHKMISNYIKSQYLNKNISESCEIYLEYFPRKFQPQCYVEVWNKTNFNVTVTTSSFLGLKIDEREPKLNLGYPVWFEKSISKIGLDKISGMIGSHDHYNLHMMVGLLISQKSIYYSEYKDDRHQDNQNHRYDYLAHRRQCFDGNKNGFSSYKFPHDGKAPGLKFSNIDHILTVENQLKILNGEIKERFFYGFGLIDREKLLKVYIAKCIEIAHSEIETHSQILAGIGPIDDFTGVLGIPNVFGMKEDVDNGRNRVLSILGRYSELNVTKEILNMIASKKTILSNSNVIEKFRIYRNYKIKTDNEFISVIIKHLGENKEYFNNEFLEISYAPCDRQAVDEDKIKDSIINFIINSNPDKSKSIIKNMIKCASIYNATKDFPM